MWKRTAVLWIVLAGLVPAASPGQTTPLSEHPGFFPIDELEIFSQDDLTIEINLTGAMLRMIAKATGEDDPEFSALVSDLEGIRVRIAPVDRLDPEKTRSEMARGAALLEERGWLAMVRIRDHDEEVYIYSRESGEAMAGLTVFVVDETDAVVLNLIGSIDTEKLGSLVMGLDLPQVGRALEMGGDAGGVNESETEDPR